MVAPLLRVAVCSPRSAGWNQPEPLARWQELGFHHAPDFDRALAQHGSLHGELSAAGAEVVDIIPSSDLSLDAVYAHDASLPTDFGLILMLPGKANRTAEAKHHGVLSQRLGIPILGEITAPDKYTVQFKLAEPRSSSFMIKPAYALVRNVDASVR